MIGVALVVVVLGGWWLFTQLQFVALPDQEKKFVSTVDGFIERYRTGNAIEKRTLRAERRRALQQLALEGQITNWVGHLTKIGTSLGDAYIAVRLEGSKPIYVETWNNLVSDHSAATLISTTSSLYQKIAACHENDTVEFSGQFIVNSESADYLTEMSMTEYGSMTEPEFVFRFSDLRKR